MFVAFTVLGDSGGIPKCFVRVHCAEGPEAEICVVAVLLYRHHKDFNLPDEPCTQALGIPILLYFQVVPAYSEYLLTLDYNGMSRKRRLGSLMCSSSD